MAIRIERNEAGNCINFHGSSNPVYFNACLSAEIDPEFPDTINVINDIKTQATDSIPQYEFYRMPFTDFIRADFTPFTSAADAVAYIVENGNVAGNINILKGYLGVLDASAGLDIYTDVSNYINGAWYYVTTEGDQILDPNLPAVTLKVDDIIRISKPSDDDVTGTWQHIPNINASVAEIQSSNLTSFDYHVDQSSTSSIETGSVIYPFKAIESALDVMLAGQSLNIKGSYTTLAPININKSIHIEGTFGAELKFFEFHKDNGNILHHTGSATDKIIIKEIIFRNAGAFGILSELSEVFEIRKCKFFNCGWNGQGINTAAPSSLTGVLGYDSLKVDLKDHYDNSGNISNGGAILIKECTKPLIRESRAEGNLRGFRLQDCGFNGGGFIIENQSIGNLDSGIYLAAGLTHYGCQNITVTINYSSFNANNGLLAIGGLNNKFSQNEVYKNWNAGACAWGSANYTLRDCGLYDNNRSKYNGIGNDGDAKAGIQINEAYNLLGTTVTYHEDARFIAEILDTQVHYTGEGANDKKVGILISSSLNSLPYDAKNIIKIDDVGFIDQDIAIDLSEVNTTNLKVMLGDNSFVNIKEKNIKDPISGYYSELPYSNHITNIKELDIVVDTIKQFVALHEGVGGKVLNTYKINELQSIETVRGIDLIQTGTKKIQLWDNTLGNVYINGVQAGVNIPTMNNSVNSALTMSLVNYKDFIESEVGVIGDDPATFFYIESPDGVFDYPLFKTEAEANAFDLANGGTGTGSSHLHTYDDDLSNTTWYMPTNLGVMDASSAPVNGIYGNSTNVVWNIQPTDDDANYAATFNSITYNIQEGDTVNIPYKPVGDTATYNITNIPNGYADDGYNIIGTAEDITNGYGQSVQHVINVTKVPSGGFDSTQGTITINIKADLASNEFTLVDQNGVIKFTQDGGITVLDFNNVTFNAGSTYKFYLDGTTMQTDDIVNIVDINGDGITGNDGLTQIGAGAGYAGAHFQYVIPSDVAPGKFITFTDGATSTDYADVPLTIAGSTYIANPTGVTLEGPTANQTGLNVMDAGDHGWISLNETLSAGERLVLDNAFFADFLDETKGNNTIFAIGLKGDNWTNTKEVNNNGAAASGEFFKGNTYIVGVWSSSSSSVSMWLCANGVLGNSMLMNTTSLFGTACAFLEVTSDGNNIRSGFGRNNSTGNITVGDESTVEYSNWNAYKGETGDQGFGISNIDVVMSFWTYDGGAIDGNEIDWTGLSEVSVPTPPTSSMTTFNKAVDFSASTNRYVYMNDSDSRWPLLKLPAATVAAHSSDPSKTSDASGAEPFMVSCVFQPGATAPSVQGTGGTRGGRIWGCGQGVSIEHYNIMLEQHANNDIIFSWGKVGNYNGLVSEENNLRVIENADPNKWYGVYIAHRGHRSSAPSAADLGAMFDIYVMSGDDNFAALGSNVSTPTEWGQSWNQTGKSITDSIQSSSYLHFGGLYHSNSAFSGKIASFVCHPLHGDADMPDANEVKKVIVDPIGWANDLVGTSQKNYVGSGYTFAFNSYTAALSTQIYLFGDGTNDSFSGGIRNQVHPGDTSYTDLSFVNGQSTDIVNISQTGL